jgi:hypothetical protein
MRDRGRCEPFLPEFQTETLHVDATHCRLPLQQIWSSSEVLLNLYRILKWRKQELTLPLIGDLTF